MDRIINVQVTGCTVKKDSKNAGVQGEANATTLRITFSPEWEALSKKIIWLDAGGGNPVAKILTTETDGAFETTIPGEPLAKAGQCCFTIQGVKDSLVAMAVTEHLTVLPNDSYGMEAGNAADPTPSVADQINEKISAAVYTVNGVKPDASGNVNTPGAGTGGEVVPVNGKNGIVVLKLEDLEGFKQSLLDCVRPVGSYYWSDVDTDPGTLFGGTWERVKDRFILAAGDTYAAGATGGEATHTLTVEEMPGHTHVQQGVSNDGYQVPIIDIKKVEHIQAHRSRWTKAIGAAGKMPC